MKYLILDELIQFYDNRVEESKRMATAVNSVMGEEFSVALMMNYFESNNCKVEILPGPCKGKTNKGVRLDRWIHVAHQDKSHTLFQTEIKNWSAHSIGGRRIPANINEEELKKLTMSNWKTRFDQFHIPREKEASKVLTRMSVPDNFPHMEPTPLICFWEAMHPSGELNPYFTMEINHQEFSQIHIFSLSNYVRTLKSQGIMKIPARLPNAEKVINWMNRIYF